MYLRFKFHRSRKQNFNKKKKGKKTEKNPCVLTIEKS